MGISALNKIKVLGSELFDAVVGAEQPKMYYAGWRYHCDCLVWI